MVTAKTAASSIAPATPLRWAASKYVASRFRTPPHREPILLPLLPSFVCTLSPATTVTVHSPRKRSKLSPASLRSTASSLQPTASPPRSLPDIPFWLLSPVPPTRSEEHTSELQSQSNLVCRLLLEKKKTSTQTMIRHYPSLS